MVAVLGCHVSVVKQLLSHGADVEVKAGNWGATALLCACTTRERSLEMVKLLVEAGADVQVADEVIFYLCTFIILSFYLLVVYKGRMQCVAVGKNVS